MRRMRNMCARTRGHSMLAGPNRGVRNSRRRGRLSHLTGQPRLSPGRADRRATPTMAVNAFGIRMGQTCLGLIAGPLGPLSEASRIGQRVMFWSVCLLLRPWPGLRSLRQLVVTTETGLCLCVRQARLVKMWNCVSSAVRGNGQKPQQRGFWGTSGALTQVM